MKFWINPQLLCGAGQWSQPPTCRSLWQRSYSFWDALNVMVKYHSYSIFSKPCIQISAWRNTVPSGSSWIFLCSSRQILSLYLVTGYDRLFCILANSLFTYTGVSQTVVLGFCPCGPFRLNISPKKTEKNKINVNCLSHTIVENLKQSLEITYNKRL